MRKESRDLAVISWLCLEINHHSLYCTVLFQSHYAFTSVWNPGRLCSWSKSVIVSSPHPLLLSALCHNLWYLQSLVQFLECCPLALHFLPLFTHLSTSTLISHCPPTPLFNYSSHCLLSLCTFIFGQLCVYGIYCLCLCIVTLISNVPIIPLQLAVAAFSAPFTHSAIQFDTCRALVKHRGWHPVSHSHIWHLK